MVKYFLKWARQERRKPISTDPKSDRLERKLFTKTVAL